MDDSHDAPPPGFDDRNRERFNAARAAATEHDMVCATVGADKEPRYFVMPADAGQEDIEARAFQIRNGRPISEGEGALIATARQQGRL